MTTSATYFKHPSALVETENVGEGTRIWAFAHILPQARVGQNCNICDHTFIENQVVIGDRVTIKSGVQLWDGVEIEDDVFIGPNATFTNDAFPRSGQHQETIPRTLVRKGASIGANATILPGVTIGARAMVGAGSVVTHDVPADTILAGNPARIVGYVGVDASEPPPQSSPATGVGSVSTRVEGVLRCRLPLVEDLRGVVSFGETGRHIPFLDVKRYFLVFGVPGRHIRGEHAHKRLHQFLVCVQGSVRAVVDDGATRQEFLLDDRTLGLYVPPMRWCVQYQYSADAVLLVLASDHYDPDDYIRDYSEFLLARNAKLGTD